MSNKLRAKFKLEKRVEKFFTASTVQITNDGEELLCENDSSIRVLSVRSGTPSYYSQDNKIPDNESVIKVGESPDTQDFFQDASIECDDGDRVTAMRLSPDGKKLIVAFNSRRLKLYSWPDRTVQRSINAYHRMPVSCLAWEASSNLFVTGAADGTARVWDCRRNVCTHTIRDAPGVFGCAVFHPCLNTHPLLYAGVNNVLYVWKLCDGSYELLHKLDDAHHLRISNLLISADSNWLVSLGVDRVVILWDAKTLHQQLVGAVGQAVSAGVLLPLLDGQKGVRLLIAGETGHLSVWHLYKKAKEEYRTSEVVVSIPPSEAEEGTGLLPVTGVYRVPALESIIVTSYDHYIVFLKEETLKPWKLFCGNNDQVLSVLLVTTPSIEGDVSSSKELIVAATNSPDIRLYNVSDMSCRLVRGHTAIVLALSKHPSNKHVFASSSHDNSVRIWRTTEDCGAICVATALGHSQSVATVALGIDIVVSCGQDRCIKLWHLSQEILNTTATDNVESNKVFLSNSSAQHSLVCKQTELGHDKDINCVAISRKDHFIATGSRDKTIKLWNGKDLSLVKTFNGHKKGVWCVQFSPVDKLLASTSADGTILIWSLDSLSMISRLEGHECSVLNLQWINHGLQLASTSADGVLKLWEVKTGVCVETFGGHDDESRVWGLDSVEDGDRLVSGAEDGRIILWRDVTKELTLEEMKEKQKQISEQQTVANLLYAERWEEALILTLKCNQPFNSLRAIEGILQSSGEERLGAIIDKLEEAQLGNLIEFVTKWNTRAKTCYEAIVLLHHLVTTRLPEDLRSLPFWESNVEALLSYTNKHADRINKMEQAVGFMEYCTYQTTLYDEKFRTPALGHKEELDPQKILSEVMPNEVTPQVEDADDASSSSEDSEKEDFTNEGNSEDDITVPLHSQKNKNKSRGIEDLEIGYALETIDAPNMQEEADSSDSEPKESFNERNTRKMDKSSRDYEVFRETETKRFTAKNYTRGGRTFRGQKKRGRSFN